jgi:hypothetical protein
MGSKSTSATATVSVAPAAISERVTKALLGCGLAAGPVWVGVVLIQMLTRTGFDIRRHAVSQLTLGDLGWIQVANFILAGLLVVAFAIGTRRALDAGRAGTWGPRLIGAFGLGLIGAGIFVADPGNGFPPGAANVPGQISVHGAMHLLFASAAFLSLIIASAIVFARRFVALRQREWTVYSIATGAYFCITWLALAASGARIAVINVAFAVGVVLAWTWLTQLAAQLVRARRTRVAPTQPDPSRGF